jgi:hypothetical protein
LELEKQKQEQMLVQKRSLVLQVDDDVKGNSRFVEERISIEQCTLDAY